MSSSLKDDASNLENESEKIDLNTLSELIGFPKDYIKEELLLSKENMSIEELRKIAADYLSEAFAIKEKNFPQ